MSTSQSKHFHRAPQHRLGGAVVFSILFAAFTLLLTGGCDKGPSTTATAKQVRSVEVEGATSKGSDAIAAQPTAQLTGLEVEKLEDSIPIKFMQQSPIPFKMDLEPNLVITGTPLPPEEVAHVRQVLELELKRYPPGLLKPLLGSVAVFKTLAVNEQPAGGSYFIGLVYIAAGAYPPGEARDNDIRRVLHHEISSIFMRMHWGMFDDAKFRSLNPPDFEYAYPNEVVEGEPPRKAYAAADIIPSLTELGDGFLVPYARSNLEQDFNSYAEILLWRPELLLKLFAPDSTVGRKARVVRDFYIAIDKRFEPMFAPFGK